MLSATTVGGPESSDTACSDATGNHQPQRRENRSRERERSREVERERDTHTDSEYGITFMPASTTRRFAVGLDMIVVWTNKLCLKSLTLRPFCQQREVYVCRVSYVCVCVCVCVCEEKRVSRCLKKQHLQYMEASIRRDHSERMALLIMHPWGGGGR